MYKLYLIFYPVFIEDHIMDIYASAALTGAGYALSKQRDALKKNEYLKSTPHAGDLPSMKNIYSSDYYTTTREDERSRGMKMFNDSQSPFETGIVPRPAYADMFASPDTPYKTPDNSYENNIRTLSGNTLNVEEFTHNNMQPYLVLKYLIKY